MPRTGIHKIVARASVDGVSPAEHPRAVQERVGFVSEVSHLYPDLGVERFLHIAAGLRGLAGNSRSDAVARAIDTFDLAAVRKRRIGNLSKGFTQRSRPRSPIRGPALG